MNVLITNIGRRGYLVKFLKQNENFDGRVFVSDCDITASGLYGPNDGQFILPKPIEDEKKYINALLEVCLKNDIRVIIPVIDPEIFILSKYVGFFGERGITVVVSSEFVLGVCYNKLNMNDFLAKNGFLLVPTYDSIDEFRKSYQDKTIDFPVIVKPIYGSGSINTQMAFSFEEVVALFKDGCIIQECIDGEEYGIDIFNNFKGEPIRCVIKKKISMRSGETDKAISVYDEDILRLMSRLAEKLGHIGNLDVDLIKRGKDIYIIDLNPRFGGGYPATHLIGVNLLDVIIKLVAGEDVEPEFNNYESNILVMKEVGLVTTRL